MNSEYDLKMKNSCLYQKDDEIFNDIYADIDEMSDEEVEVDYYSSSDENGDDEHESDSLLETEPDFQLESDSIRDKLRYDRSIPVVDNIFTWLQFKKVKLTRPGVAVLW